MIRVAVNGANGKMGAESVSAIKADAALELVGAYNDSNDLATKIVADKADVVVDFTTPHVAYANTKTIIESGAHPVIGTTGFTPEQITELKELSQSLKRGGIIAPNFAIGAILMMQFAKDCATYFPHVEIIEYHHNHKADAPSGTAIKTAELIAENRKVPTATVAEKEMIKGARGGQCQDIPIHSVRLPGIVANQQVIFGGDGQTLSITHDTINRQAFMPGVVLACKAVKTLDTLVYGLENILTATRQQNN